MRRHLLFATLLALAATADTLVTTSDTIQGFFAGTADNAILFQQWDASKPTKYDAHDVRKMDLDKPVEAKLFRSSSKKDFEAVTVRKFSKGKLSVVQKGEKKQIQLNMINRIEVPQMDMATFMARRKAAQSAKESPEEGKPVSAKSVLTDGKANIVHFHVEDGPSSQRQGNLAERLCNDTRGRVVYHKITVVPDDATCQKNKLQTLPQFWFYDRSGKLVKKLDNRFSEEDITQAFKSIH